MFTQALVPTNWLTLYALRRHGFFQMFSFPYAMHGGEPNPYIVGRPHTWWPGQPAGLGSSPCIWVPHHVFESKVSGIRYQVSGIRYQLSGIRYQVSGIRYQVSGIRYQVSGIRHQVSELIASVMNSLQKNHKI